MILVNAIFLVLFASIGLASAGESELEARQLLVKMSHAMEVLNYQGTVALLRNGKLEPMKYVHAAEKGIEQERLTSLNSPLREIIRGAGQVSCLFKETQQTLVDYRPFERSFLLDVPSNLDDTGAVYQFEIVAEENVAMLPSYVVAVQPKDKARYSRKIWVEKQQFLPLKAVVYDNAGLPLEQVVFTDIEVKDALPFIAFKRQDAANQAQSSDQAAFVVTALPKGFREIFFTRKPMHDAGLPVDHLVLSDGFTSVSVYMENKNPTMQSGLQAIGAVNSYSRTLNNYQLTVMGVAPAETVKLIAEGIKLRDSKE